MQFDESVTAIDSTRNRQETSETIVVGLERKRPEIIVLRTVPSIWNPVRIIFNVSRLR